MVLRKTSVLAHLVCIRDWPRLGTRSVFSNNRLITRELGNKATVKFVYVKTWSLELSQMPFELSPWFVQLWLFKSVSEPQFTPENLFLTIMESQSLENHYTAVAGWLLHGTTAAQCIVLVPVTVNIVFMASFLLSLVPYLWHVRPATESKCAIINIRMAFSY